MEFNRRLLILSNLFPNKDNSFYGGIFVKEQVNELKKYFKEITVISPQPLGTKRNLKDYNYDNVKVYYPRFFHLPVNYFRRRLGDNFFKAALNVIEREKLEFDLIHAHFAWPSGYTGLLLKRKFNVPLVITAHGFDVYDVPFRDSGYREKVLTTLTDADHVITVSRSNMEILIKNLGLSSDKLSLIPNGFDGELFKLMPKHEARKELGLPLNRKIILTVGALIPVKGHEYLIKAAKDVIAMRRDVLFVIVGSGPLRKKLEKLVDSLGLQNYFYFAGGRPHDEIPLWMNAADLFVLSSLRESFGVVVLEALAVGTPAVATINGGSENIIISEDYGFLCPSKHPKYLTEKILIALEKEWNREKIREYAQQFTWNFVTKRILKVYDEILR